QGGKLSLHHLLDCFDLRIRDHCQTVTPIAQDADQLPCLENLDVAVQLHGMVEEQVAGKHGNGDVVPHPAPSGPGLDLGEKRLKSLAGELVKDHLLAVAVAPQGIPLPCPRVRAQALISRRETRSLSLCREVFWQGSAPFGSDHSPTRPTSSSRLLVAKVPSLNETGIVSLPGLASLRADHALARLFHSAHGEGSSAECLMLV